MKRAKYVKYKVVYLFLNGYGIQMFDELTADGHGFTQDEAEAIASDLRGNYNVLMAQAEKM